MADGDIRVDKPNIPSSAEGPGRYPDTRSTADSTASGVVADAAGAAASLGTEPGIVAQDANTNATAAMAAALATAGVGSSIARNVPRW